MLVAKTPRDTQAEMCDYLVEEESLHGNFFELKKNAQKCKSEKKLQKNCETNKSQKNAKNAEKMRKTCDPTRAAKTRSKKKEKQGNKKGLTTELPGGTSKIAALLSPRQNLPLSKTCPLETFVP